MGLLVGEFGIYLRACGLALMVKPTDIVFPAP